MFHEMIEQKEQKLEQRDDIVEFIANLNEQNQVIDSVEALQKIMRKEKNVKVKQKELSSIMKNQLGMSYRKIKMITLKTNSERNLVLR